MTAHDAPLAVTMGDPSGIGPEIIAKMYLRRPDERHWIVVGDPLVMNHALPALDADVRVRPIASLDESVLEDGTLNVLCSSQLGVLPPVSQVSAIGGRAGVRRDRRRDPTGAGRSRGRHRHRADPQGGARRRRRALSRPHRDAAGARRERRASPPVRMMLANDELRTVLVTIHCRCASAIDAVTFDAVLRDACASRTRRRGRWASPRRASRSPASIRTPARAGCSATRRSRIIAPGDRGGARRGHRRARPVRARHGLHARPRRAGHPGEFDIVVAMTTTTA